MPRLSAEILTITSNRRSYSMFLIAVLEYEGNDAGT